MRGWFFEHPPLPGASLVGELEGCVSVRGAALGGDPVDGSEELKAVGVFKVVGWGPSKRRRPSFIPLL
jgi:hypothetical protein